MQTTGSPLPTPALEATHGFSVGTVLSRSFSVWFSNLPLYLGVSFVCYLPLLLVPQPDAANPASSVVSLLVATILRPILAAIVSAAVIRAVFEQLRGNRVSFGDSIGVALRSFVSVLVTSIAMGVLVMLWSFLLIVPGIVKACSYFVAVPATIVEGTDVSDSLARSKTLTSGYRWHIFGLFLISGLLGAVIGGAAGVIFRGISGPLQMLLVGVVPGAIVGSLSAVFYGVGYYQLRVVKEGIDIEQLAAVFD